MAPLIRICALTAAVLAALSLVLFAIDQSSAGTKTQVNTIKEDEGTGAVVVSDPSAINVPNPEPAVERQRELRHSSIREHIDDANDVIVSPFTGIVTSNSVWAQRLVPGILAILLFGGGGLLLANFLPKGSNETRDWREVSSS